MKQPPSDIEVSFADVLRDLARDLKRVREEKPRLVQRLAMLNLPDRTLVYICDAIDEVCNECWQNDTPCHCWNDE